MDTRRNKAEVREILEGYVDTETRAHAINAVGKTGLNSRMSSILFLGAFVRSLHASIDRKVFRYFTGLIAPILETAQSAWLTELIRIMDPAQTGRREHLTVASCHTRFRSCTEFSDNQKADERDLYRALTAVYQTERFQYFRNEQMFHLDLQKSLDPPRASGDMQRVSLALFKWYRFVARATIGDEPRYVTETAPRTGREQAMAMKRLFVDSLRWQAAKGPPYRASDCIRYGWASGGWINWLEDRLPGTRTRGNRATGNPRTPN